MIRLDDLVDATGGYVVGRPPATGTFSGFAFDSRNIRAGELFIAIRTARADGHDHIGDALARGAAGVLADRLSDVDDGSSATGTFVVVRDVRTALQAWASRQLSRIAPQVVAVTGTAGKTTSTAAIASVLSRLGDSGSVFENANRNDLLGLPIALGSLEERHRVAVLELATDRAGEMGALTDLCRPEIAVVLGVLPEAEPFDGVDDAVAEYLAVTKYARHLVVNTDDAILAEAVDRLNASGTFAGSITTIGAGPRADVRATEVRSDLAGLHVTVVTRDTTHRVVVALHGTHWVSAVLATVAVATSLGHPASDALSGLADVCAVAGRLALRRGRHRAQILDDTFSANVPSTLASLHAIATLPRPRLVVLGEVGNGRPPSPEVIARLGEQVAAVADAVVAVGDVADAIARAARASGLNATQVATVHRPAEALAHAATSISGEDAPTSAATPDIPATWSILVKGNARARLELVTAGLLDDPETAPDILVRQDRGARGVVHTGRDRPAWLELDLDAIAGNVVALRQLVAPAAVMAVLKADAYGHGAVRVARTVLHHGATALATAVLSEAADLRAAGITAPILVLGHLPPWQAREAVRLGVSVTVFDEEAARHLSEAAVAVGRTVQVHLKVDTGLRRIGLEIDAVVPYGQRLADLPGIAIEGLYTHLATADAADRTFAREQLARFNRVIEAWCGAGLSRPRWIHAANSAAAMHLPDARFDLVRPGIAVYGIAPGPEAPLSATFRAALQLKTRIAQVKLVKAGESVSYGRTWVAPSDTLIGVLPIGYGDGLRRGPRTWGGALIRGRRVPFVGRICMDMCMVDVTGIPGVRTGDHTVLIGRQGGETISVEEVAAHAGTSPYEVTTQILARVPREVVSREFTDAPDVSD
jgi:alanine racemase